MTEKIVETLIYNKIIPKEDRELYTYGFQQGWIFLTNIFTTILIGWVFNMLRESIVFLIIYMPLRFYAGGYHAKTPLRCYLLSILLISTVLLGTKTFQWIDSLLIIFIATTWAGGIIYLLAPVESRNKPLCDKERKVYKSRTGIILLFLFTMELVLCISGQEEIVIAIIMTFIAVAMMEIAGLIKNKGESSFGVKKEI